MLILTLLSLLISNALATKVLNFRYIILNLVIISLIIYDNIYSIDLNMIHWFNISLVDQICLLIAILMLSIVYVKVDINNILSYIYTWLLIILHLLFNIVISFFKTLHIIMIIFICMLSIILLYFLFTHIVDIGNTGHLYQTIAGFSTNRPFSNSIFNDLKESTSLNMDKNVSDSMTNLSLSDTDKTVASSSSTKDSNIDKTVASSSSTKDLRPSGESPEAFEKRMLAKAVPKTSDLGYVIEVLEELKNNRDVGVLKTWKDELVFRTRICLKLDLLFFRNDAKGVIDQAGTLGVDVPSTMTSEKHKEIIDKVAELDIKYANSAEVCDKKREQSSKVVSKFDALCKRDESTENINLRGKVEVCIKNLLRAEEQLDRRYDSIFKKVKKEVKF